MLNQRLINRSGNRAIGSRRSPSSRPCIVATCAELPPASNPTILLHDALILAVRVEPRDQPLVEPYSQRCASGLSFRAVAIAPSALSA